MLRYKNKKVNTRTLYIMIGIIILVTILANILVSHRNSEKVIRGEQTPEEIKEETKQNIILTLQDMEERQRMEYYFGIFLAAIEQGEYGRAYSLLYEDFKKTYFPTQQEFETYIQKVFGEMTNIEFYNIERNGDLYILWIYLTDAINGNPNDKKQMNIIIQENDYNDFVMSFSVI